MNVDLPIRHGVSDVSEPMHVLRHHLRRQPIGPSYEQAIQAPHDSSQTSCQIPEGKYVPGTYVQATWGNKPDNGKSTSGYLSMMAGGPLSSQTALQSVTAQSTMEAELISVALASKEVVISPTWKTV